MKRTLLRVAIVVAGLAGLGATALAFGPRGWHHGYFKAMVSEKIDGALDAAKATPAQRNLVQAARDHVFTTVEEGKKGHGAEIEHVLALFEADQVDPAALQAMRAAREVDSARVGDAIVQALTDAHDALTPPQRRAVVAYFEANKPSHMGGGHHGFMKRMVSSRVDEALDAAKATPEQRARIEAARDRIFAAFEQERDNPAEHFAQAARLFEADRLDQAKIAELRAEHQAKMRKLGDVITQAVTEAHDVLSAPQRRAIVEWVRAHHGDPG
jgi:Spy/CpxP family protein refolding chaperone